VTANLTDPTAITPRLYDIIKAWESWIVERQAPHTLINAQLTYFQNALLRGGVSRDSIYSIESLYQTWRLFAEDYTSLLLQTETKKQLIGELEGQLFSLIHGSQVFLTDDDRVGIVTGDCDARIGDQVWLFVGGLTPFIVRQCEDTHTDGDYRLITPCYFHNHIMKQIGEWAGPVQKLTLR